MRNFSISHDGAGAGSTAKLKLLLPLDGSLMAESSIEIVRLLSSRYVLDLMLFHVIETDAPMTIHGDRHLTDISEAEQYLQGMAEDLQNGDIKSRVAQITVHVHQSAVDDVAQSIVDHSDEHNSDLIVLCTHGIGGAREAIFGSLAQQALKRGTRPVLLIPPAMAKPGVCPLLRKIMVPVDADHFHEPTIALAAEVARKFSAELHLVTVIPTPENTRGEMAFNRRFLPNTMKAFLDMTEKEVSEQMNARLGSKVLRDINAKTAVLRGGILSQLSSYVQSAEIDMFIVTSHGRHGISALFEGSLVTSLIYQTAIPLLLVRPQDDQ